MRDHGEVTREEWGKIVRDWESKFGGGSFWCWHEYGEMENPLTEAIAATVVYPNGVKKKMYKSKGDRVKKCGLCGKIKGESIDYF